MERITAQSSEVLLARVNRELEQISDTQHRLARRKSFLQHQATRLRLGASPLEVRVALRASAIGEEQRNRLGVEWTDEAKREGNERYGGTLL
jgi:hypothetical protein